MRPSIKPAVGSYPHHGLSERRQRPKAVYDIWDSLSTFCCYLTRSRLKRTVPDPRVTASLHLNELFLIVFFLFVFFEINEKSEKERVCVGVQMYPVSQIFVYLGRVGPWGGWKVPCQSQSCRNVPTTCVPKSPPSAAGWEEAKQPSPKPSAWRETDRLEGEHCRLPIKHSSVIMLGHQNFGKHLERP